MEPTWFYLPPDTATPHATWGVIVLFGGVLFAVALGWTLLRRARHLRNVRRAETKDAGGALTLGSTVVQGRVTDDGQGPPMTVTIEQVVSTWKKSGPTWNETERAATARPFHIRRADGEIVRVEPDERTLLVAALDVTDPLGTARRRRMARLMPGQLVDVTGQVTRGPDQEQGGYRDGAMSFVVRAPAVISTEPLGATDARLARADGFRVRLLLVGLLVAHGLFFGRVWLLELRGQRRQEPVSDAGLERRWSTPRQGSPHLVTRYYVAVAGPRSERFETSPDFWAAVHRGEVSEAPVLRCRPLAQLGTHAAASVVLLTLFVILFALPLVGGALLWQQADEPWYATRRLVEPAQS